MISESHLAFLNLGSNIQPEQNLPRALKLLSGYGEIHKISNVWESRAVGTNGPNYLNACIAFRSIFSQQELKDGVIRPIESQLGRKRSKDKFAPRTMDIDIVLFDDKPVKADFWDTAYVVVPLAELYPDYRNPKSGETVDGIATRLRQEVWLKTRPGVLG